jgi:hypothetical protein
MEVPIHNVPEKRFGGNSIHFEPAIHPPTDSAAEAAVYKDFIGGNLEPVLKGF